MLTQEVNVDGLVQDCSNSSALAMELLQSCAKLSMWSAVIFSLPLSHSTNFTGSEISSSVLYGYYAAYYTPNYTTEIHLQHVKSTVASVVLVM